jgi:hypothetical protein
MRAPLKAGFYYAASAVPLMIAGLVGADAFGASAQTREIIFFLCLATALGMIIVGATKEVRNEASAISKSGHGRRVIAIWGMGVCGLGFLAFAGAYFWPSKPIQEADASPLDGAIQIICEPAMYPATVPQNKFIELQLNNNFITEGGVFIFQTQAAGTVLPPRDPSIFPIHGWKLRISNYGKVAVINATVAFPVEFSDAIKGEKGTSNGNVFKSVSITTNPFSIGPGEIIDIYALNYSVNAYAKFLIPQTAQGYMPGSDKQETFKLIPPFLDAFLPPFEPKAPPAPPRPVPTQQARPKTGLRAHLQQEGLIGPQGNVNRIGSLSWVPWKL